ncbi:N-acyl-D-glucosamine 2-epimerase [Nocardioides sp. Root1257]|uniref:AGE family epimerase/isomerase n=1 Tax=unclassified Nocardioides TaxID=2615069 RepID=UPI0006FD8C1D|nr:MULTISPECIES: AGE family epimerase/isomerase [unclassified Nocardioides]KQW47441.1 N-acyl-D-glucosamine 2-epimerase [Nocardioides sp. Root1257]KRC45597.1 N-acyl-D-glucosamine 2-epimerase [Nocardioides sp. Root224]
MDLDAEGRRLLAFAAGGELPGTGFGWLDDAGAVDRSRGVHTWITARMTHVFSLAALAGEPGAAARAATGVEALLAGPLRDRSYDGWLGAVDLTGSPLDEHKRAYDHAFVVLAACSAVTAGVPDAETLLDDAVAVFDERFLDDAGLVVDGYGRDLCRADDYRGANSSMHTVEALLALGDLRGDRRWHDLALGIAELLIHRVATAYDFRLPEHYDPAWTPLPAYNADRRDDQFRPYGVTPGHLLEWSRLLLQLEASVTDPPPWLASDAIRLFDVAVRIGWAVDGRPGFVYTTDLQDAPVVRHRMHWVHAEAIGAAAALGARTGAAPYAVWQSTWWEFVERHLRDPRTGTANWHHELDAENRPVAQVWSGRPDVYHAYQAILLSRHPLGASLAGALSRA